MHTTHSSRETNRIAKMIERELLTWDGVTVQPHRFGGIEFRVNHHEIGHLHGDYQADLPFTTRIRKQLVVERSAEPHHIYPNSGWVTYYIHSAEDVPGVIELFRQNYQRWITANQRSVTDRISA